MSGSNLIIPFFLAQEGCPHTCVYCNQERSVTFSGDGVTAAGVDERLSRLPLSGDGESAHTEVAFFGGSFTCLPQGRQVELLEAAARHKADGRVQGIRLSTRPDALGPDEIDLLVRCGVTAVEIGAQSFDDRALRSSGRGHTARDTVDAARRVRAAGLTLGLQFLLGLPGETEASGPLTVRTALDLKPDEARIYPLLVLRDTPLHRLFEQGRYKPLDLENAVRLSADYFSAFFNTGIRILRIGLHNDPRLEESMAAGPFHPAFGELVKAEAARRSLEAVLTREPPGSDDGPVLVAPPNLSQALGHKRANVKRLQKLFPAWNVKLQADHRAPVNHFIWKGERYGLYKADSTFPVG